MVAKQQVQAESWARWVFTRNLPQALIGACLEVKDGQLRVDGTRGFAFGM